MRALCASALACALLAASSCGGEPESGGPAPADTRPPAPPAPPERPPFDAALRDGGTTADAAPSEPPVDPAFDARLKKQIRGVVKGDYATYDWDALLHAHAAWSGVKIWVPGTGERTADDAGGRAMASVPSGLGSLGAAVTYAGTAAIGPWLGVPCSQSVGGALFAQRDRLSALEVFATAWPDALAIVKALGPKVKGAWLVGHSAGALPALLAGLVGGAHRVDVYGVPSAVGPLDGDDGLAHLHTHPLDPAGSMGSLDGSGEAQIDLLSAFVVTLKAGGTMAYHDYASWPAPSP
jgi:hypothetical protein